MDSITGSAISRFRPFSPWFYYQNTCIYFELTGGLEARYNLAAYSKNTPGGMGQHLRRFLDGFHHGKCDFPFWAIFTVVLLLKYVYFELTEGLEARYNLVA